MYSQVFKGQSLCSLITCMSAGYRLNAQLDAAFEYRRFPRHLEARFPAIRLDGLVCGRTTASGEVIAPASQCQISALPVDLGEDLWLQSLPRVQPVAVQEPASSGAFSRRWEDLWAQFLPQLPPVVAQEPAPPRAISRRWASGVIVTAVDLE